MSNSIGLLGNIVIKGLINTKTGLHIGASADTVEIGGIDSPVIRHPVNGKPYIPGSSLKGKMRSFLEKMSKALEIGFNYNREVAPRIKQHVCNSTEFSEHPNDNRGALKCPVCRVYGSTGRKTNNVSGLNHPARIIVRDCNLLNVEDLKKENLLVFEAKMENAIDRITAGAHPRTFERVPAGAKFDFEIIYKVQGEFQNQNGQYRLTDTEFSNIQTDIHNIFEVLGLVEKDGLGGSISRGYGQIEFKFEVGERETFESEIKYYPASGTPEGIVPDKGYETIEKLRQYDFSNLKNIILGDKRK